MRHRTAWDFFSQSATERQSLVVGLMSLGVSILAYLIDTSAKIPVWIVVCIILAGFSTAYILIAALKDSVGALEPTLPKVLATLPVLDDDEKLTLLIEPSDLFGAFSQVTIYNKHRETGFEQLIGYGEVAIVQGDRKIQVIIEEWTASGMAFRDGLANQNQSSMDCTLIRPSAPKRFRGGMANDRQFIALLADAFQKSVEVSEDSDGDPA